MAMIDLYKVRSMPLAKYIYVTVQDRWKMQKVKSEGSTH